MFGDSELYGLLNVAGVTSLLDSYGTGYALFNDPVIPQDCTGSSTVNFYLSSPYNPALPYDQYRYTINCRADSYVEAVTIAGAVVTAAHRITGTDYLAVCTMLPVISPLNDRDTYNSVVELTMKKR